MDKEARGHFSDELNRFAGARDAFVAGEIAAGEDVRSRRLLPNVASESVVSRRERIRMGAADGEDPEFRRTRPRA